MNKCLHNNIILGTDYTENTDLENLNRENPCNPCLKESTKRALIHPLCCELGCSYSLIAAIPGRTFPSIASSNAPPPVET